MPAVCLFFKRLYLPAPFSLFLSVWNLSTCSLQFNQYSVKYLRKYIPTGCTILFNIFIYLFIYLSSLHVSGVHAAITTRKLLYLCDSGTWHSIKGNVWSAGWIQSSQQTRLTELRTVPTTDFIRKT